MERLILSPRTEIFSGKWDFLKGRPKFPNGIFVWKMCVTFASLPTVNLLFTVSLSWLQTISEISSLS